MKPQRKDFFFVNAIFNVILMIIINKYMRCVCVCGRLLNLIMGKDYTCVVDVLPHSLVYDEFIIFCVSEWLLASHRAVSYGIPHN